MLLSPAPTKIDGVFYIMQALKAPSPQPSPIDKWERVQEICSRPLAQAKSFRTQNLCEAQPFSA
jgi:hypothetical protein